MKNKMIFPVAFCILALWGCMFTDTVSDYRKSKESGTAGVESTDVAISTATDNNVTDAAISGYASDTQQMGEENTYSGIIYDQLNENEKIIYNDILTGMREYKSRIILNSPLKPNSLSKVYQAINLTDELYMYCPAGNYVYEYIEEKNICTVISPEYLYTKEEAQELEAEIEETASVILSKINDDMSDSEKELILHDSLVDMCSYDTSVEDSTEEEPGDAMKDTHYHDAYGALVEKKAVCDGYARAFKYLCGKAGIECELVLGYSDGVGHMWNIVCIDGKWSYVDVTFDDPVYTGIGLIKDTVKYDYYNIDDQTLLKDHELHSEFAYPECK